MDAPQRGALMLVRFIAAALIGLSVLELALDFVASSVHREPVQIFSCLLKSIPLALGVVLLIKSKAIAAWISNKLDE
ncbi:MAG: hypothetical protein ACREFE_05830 [Limisphaerales bacterium]